MKLIACVFFGPNFSAAGKVQPAVPGQVGDQNNGHRHFNGPHRQQRQALAGKKSSRVSEKKKKEHFVIVETS